MPVERLILRLLINAAALVVAAYLVPGIRFDNWVDVLLTALVFGVVNALIRPLVSFATCLINAITLGLFTLIINALMLWLTSYAARWLGIGFYVHGFLAAFLGALIISVGSFILTRFLR